MYAALLVFVTTVILVLDGAQANSLKESADNDLKPSLKGVTIPIEPYARLENGTTISGFVVDFMDEIAKKVNISYQLYMSPDGKYGKVVEGKLTGMLGEVVDKKADFAVADITITEGRKELVDFTVPFIVNNLAVVVRNDSTLGAKSLSELYSTSNSTLRPKALQFGVLKLGTTASTLKNANSSLAQQIWSMVDNNSTNGLVHSLKEGIDIALEGNYAFIVEGAFAKYIIGQHCSLTAIYDGKEINDKDSEFSARKFGIALHKGSPYTEKFSKAVTELLEDGTVEALRQKHWTSHCDKQQ